MNKPILLWDNDGTISGSLNPLDTSSTAKVILPGVKNAMQTALLNVVISGFKSPESEAQNFDPEAIIKRFILLIEKLPISAVAFSPTIGGVACYVIIKKIDGTLIVRRAHEDPRYKHLIGQFKKPDIGMFTVMKDLVLEEFGLVIDAKTSYMIGDTWHDEEAAKTFGIPFVEASVIHTKK